MNPYEEITNLLKNHNISYKEIEHEPVYTSEQAAKVRGISASQGAKSLLLKCDDSFVIAVLPGDRKLDYKKLEKHCGAKKCRFASPQEVKDKMFCEIGACYPFGHIISLSVYADPMLSENGVIDFNPGVHNRSIEMKWQDYCAIEKPHLVSIT